MAEARLNVQSEPVLTRLIAGINSQLALAGGDPDMDSAVQLLVEALAPAFRQAVLELAEQAAAEVSAQLPDRRVEVVLGDGEPHLRVVEEAANTELRSEDYEARLTLRLPPSLKELVEQAAELAGESVNSWVVESLSSRTRRAGRGGRRVVGSFDL
jgi:tRNA(Ser,Leu) C12 N-acetylase TAN1